MKRHRFGTGASIAAMLLAPAIASAHLTRLVIDSTVPLGSVHGLRIGSAARPL